MHSIHHAFTAAHQRGMFDPLPPWSDLPHPHQLWSAPAALAQVPFSPPLLWVKVCSTQVRLVS